ncbi:hypothetical protein ACFCX4_06780 [Kitasatospora sp. NPDC056327]|uniref:hypothetical protein n=1 Tax=Kitasatospora sp. NPDC056327 TaxID=3345785 RepID=UPI0035DF97A6
MGQSGNAGWAPAGICLAYLAIVFLTSRGFIAAPQYRRLQSRIGEARARVTALSGTGPGGGPPAGPTGDAPDATAARAAVLAAVTERLDAMEHTNMIVWRFSPRSSWVLSIPLSKLAAAWRVLHACELDLIRLLPPEEATDRLGALRLKLADSTVPGDAELAADLDPPSDSSRTPARLAAAVEYLHDREDTEAEREYEQQRTALWLATIGLGAAYLIGATLGHHPTMVLGALGGFLSPLTGVLRAQRPVSWGVLVLAPVGGALAAVGGVLLVRMLADPELNLLGHVFLDNSWDAPDRPLALAVSLLFGFSGTLFSRLALTATGQLVAGGTPTGRRP